MSRLIPAAERIVKARVLIQKARDLPIPAEGGRADFSYIAQVKDLLRQARRPDQVHPHAAQRNRRDEGRSQKAISGSGSGERGNPALMLSG